MTSTTPCPNCQNIQSNEWTKTLDDSGTYTYCLSCKILQWNYPPELSPYYQEGFACEVSTSTTLEEGPLAEMLAEISKRVDEIGYRFDFELADLIDMDADRADQLKSLEGTIVGTAQLEMTTWLFDPDEYSQDEDSDDYVKPETFKYPQNLKLLVEKAIEEMFSNRGGDGYYFERHQIGDALQGLTYGGKPVEISVSPGEWTGKG